MNSFIRIAGMAAIVISLGLIVSAFPIANIHLKRPNGADAVSVIFFKLCTELGFEVKLKELLECTNIDELQLKLSIVIALLKTCTDDLVKIGTGVVVNADATISLVACVLCVQVFATLSLKFGLAVCTELDVCLRALLLALETCVHGILPLIVKCLASATIGVMAQIKLKLCLAVLGL